MTAHARARPRQHDQVYRLSVQDAFVSVGSGPEGLSSAEAARRLLQYGPNSIERRKQQPLILRLLKELFQFFSIILWFAAALALIAEWYEPGQGMARVAYAIVVVIIVSGAFSFWQEYRVEQTLAALERLLPRLVEVLRDGSAVRVPAEQLVIGDVLFLLEGDRIPADCRLIEGFGVRVNSATVTGESMPRAIDLKPCGEHDPLHCRNVLLAGTSIVSGRARGLVFATGTQTELGRIAHLVQVGPEIVSPLRQQLAYVSRLIAFLSIGIGAAFFAVGAAIGVPIWQDVIFSIGVIVAMVPEGLLPTLTLALVLAAQRMAKRNVLVRHLTSVETLGSATVICTDKTGTLTRDRMQVGELLLGAREYALGDVDLALAGHYQDFFLCARICHDLKEGGATPSRFAGDPMEMALAEMAANVLPDLKISRRLDEIPFDSDRMRHSVVHDGASGPTLYCKGAPEVVLPLCSSVAVGGEIRAMDTTERQRIAASQERMAAKGLRVLALAARALPRAFVHEELEQALVFQGLVGFEDPPRPEVPDAVRKCHGAGIKVIMVTGDHPQTAAAVACEIGLGDAGALTVLTGEQLRKLSHVALDVALDAPNIVFARVTSDQKMRVVEALIGKGHVVAVTGDGVNDAPALKTAHIGVAMGVTGTEVAKEAADMVLLDDNFASIVDAVEEGRAVFQNIRKFLTYVLVHNVAQLVPYLAFALFRIPLPLTPIQALCVDMGTDGLPALGLGIELPRPQAMQLPPRPKRERLLNLSLALRAYLFLGAMEAAAAMAAYFFVLFDGGWSYGQSLAIDDPLYLRATAACLSAIIVMQVFNVFLCRSSLKSVFATSFFENRLIVWGVVTEIALLLVIVYTPWGNALLGTAPVPPALWLFLLPFGITMMTLEEARKWAVRRLLRTRAGRRRSEVQPEFSRTD